MFNSGSRRSTSSLPARANPRRVPITRSLLEWDSCPLWSRNLWAPGTASCRIRHAGDWGAAVQVPRESHRSHLPKIGGFDRTSLRGDRAGGSSLSCLWDGRNGKGAFPPILGCAPSSTGLFLRREARSWNVQRLSERPREARHRHSQIPQQEQKARSEKPRAPRGPPRARGGQGTLKLQLLLQGP